MNIASYRDLPTGRYTLMVKASGSGTAIRLPVVVEPPLWATPWAIALYIIAAAAVAFTAFSHLRTVYRQRRDIAMENGSPTSRLSSSPTYPTNSAPR